MRYIVSKQIINDNIRIAQSLVGSRTLSLMFKEYYEDIHKAISNQPTGEVFGINIEGSVCYAIGMATLHNKGSIVNSLLDARAYHSMGMNLFYIPIDAYDGREGLTVYEAKQLSENIHQFVDKSATIMGMVTNGRISERYFEFEQDWVNVWNAFDNHLTGISAGGSFWLNKLERLPKFVNDIRIGRFMLFGTIPYSEEKLGKNCLAIEGSVVGVNLSNRRIIVDLGDAYCDPANCNPYRDDMELTDFSSNYAMYSTEYPGRFYLGQRLLFTPNYRHSSALAKLNVHFDYE